MQWTCFVKGRPLNRSQLLERFQLAPPLSLAAITALQNEAGYDFPPDYVALLQITNGLTCDGQLHLLAGEDLAGRNRDYEVQAYMPGYVMIGDDSGGNAILIGPSSPEVFEVGMGVMNADWMKRSAQNLSELLILHEGRTLGEREE